MYEGGSQESSDVLCFTRDRVSWAVVHRQCTPAARAVEDDLASLGRGIQTRSSGQNLPMISKPIRASRFGSGNQLHQLFVTTPPRDAQIENFIVSR